MELTKMELFSAMNDKHPNLKDCEGQVISPIASHIHQYSDQDGKLHQVLVLKDGKTGNMYKTEVSAFIEKWNSYCESFGDLPDAEKPDIVIVVNVSKKGNRYVNFSLAGGTTVG